MTRRWPPRWWGGCRFWRHLPACIWGRIQGFWNHLISPLRERNCNGKLRTNCRAHGCTSVSFVCTEARESLALTNWHPPRLCFSICMYDRIAAQDNPAIACIAIISTLAKRSNLSPYERTFIEKHLADFDYALGACQRIQAQTIPLPYTRHTSR